MAAVGQLGRRLRSQEAEHAADFLVDNLLLVNQAPDVEADRAGGRRHLVIAHGLCAGAAVYAVCAAGAFLSVVVGVALGFLPALALIALATLPLAARRAFLYAEGSATIVSALAMNVETTLLTPSLVAVGLFLARSKTRSWTAFGMRHPSALASGDSTAFTFGRCPSRRQCTGWWWRRAG